MSLLSASCSTTQWNALLCNTQQPCVLCNTTTCSKRCTSWTIVWLPSTREELFGLNMPSHCLVRVRMLHFHAWGSHLTITQLHTHTMQQPHMHKAVSQKVTLSSKAIGLYIVKELHVTTLFKWTWRYYMSLIMPASISTAHLCEVTRIEQTTDNITTS